MFKVLRNGLLRYTPYTCPNLWCNPWICQASCRHSRLFKQLGRYAGNGSLVVKFEASHPNRKKKISSFSGLHPHIPLLLFQWTWRTHVLRGKSPAEILHLLSNLFWDCSNDTKKGVSNRLGRKKHQTHCKTWDEIAKIQKNVRPSVSAGPSLPIICKVFYIPGGRISAINCITAQKNGSFLFWLLLLPSSFLRHIFFRKHVSTNHGRRLLRLLDRTI